MVRRVLVVAASAAAILGVVAPAASAEPPSRCGNYAVGLGPAGPFYYWGNCTGRQALIEVYMARGTEPATFLREECVAVDATENLGGTLGWSYRYFAEDTGQTC